MSNKYLDDAGVLQLWAQIQAYFATHDHAEALADTIASVRSIALDNADSVADLQLSVGEIRDILGAVTVSGGTSGTSRTVTVVIGDEEFTATLTDVASASALSTHTDNTSNPHSVTKSQVGLGSVVNTGDSATPVSGGTTKFTTGGAYAVIPAKVAIGATPTRGAAASGPALDFQSMSGSSRFSILRGAEIDITASNIVGEALPKTNQLFTFRSTAGSESIKPTGTARIEKMKGNTVVWNQQCNATSISVTSTHKYLKRVSGVKLIVTGVSTISGLTVGTDNVFDLTKMFGSGNEPSTVAEFEAMFPLPYYAYNAGELISFGGKRRVFTQLAQANATSVTGLTSSHKYYKNVSGTGSIVTSSTSITGLTANQDQVFDLTATFGSGNEPETTAETELWLKQGYDEMPYYAYNEAVELAYATPVVETTGYNAFDLDTGKAELVAGAYKIEGTYTSLSFLGIDGTTTAITPSSGTFTTTQRGTLTVTGGDSTTSVHLVWSGSRTGYESYQHHSLPIKPYLPDKYKKKVYNLGELCLYASSTGAMVMYKRTANGGVKDASWTAANWTAIRCAGGGIGELLSAGSVYDSVEYLGNSQAKCIIRVGSRAYQSSDASDTSVKTDGAKTYYALATPIEITYDLSLDYWCDDYGTEAIAPVQGTHPQMVSPEIDITYGINVADTIRHLPETYMGRSDVPEALATNLVVSTAQTKEDIRQGLDIDLETVVESGTVTSMELQVGDDAVSIGSITTDQINDICV